MRHAWVLACLWLCGCATVATVQPPLDPAQQAKAEVAQQAREARLRERANWALQGRIAVSNGRDGGSGRIEWQQSAQGSDIELSAPVTRQSWRLTTSAGGARLEGIAGGLRKGSDAGVLLREATGWDIPVASLAYWVRGARAPEGGISDVQFAADGRLRELGQSGWRIVYSEWTTGPGGLELPKAIQATRDTASVKLVVDRWSAGPAAE